MLSEKGRKVIHDVGNKMSNLEVGLSFGEDVGELSRF
jgi:hypothetical protein